MVIPIHDQNPTRRVPVVTYALIAINVVVFLVSPVSRPSFPGSSPLARACQSQAFFREYGAIPKEVTTGHQLPVTAGRPVGTDGCEAVRPGYHKNVVLSVLYAMFLHGGWAHLLGNMLFLFIFGNNVEDRFGRIGYLVFYLFAGYAAAYGFAFASPDSTETLVGASGAIAGVLGAYLVLYPRARVLSLLPFLFFIPFRLPAWVVLGSWFVLQYFYAAGAGLSSGSSVAYLAHVIGFIVGIVVALPFRRGTPSPRWAYR